MAVKLNLRSGIGRLGLIVKVGGTAGGERDGDLTIKRFDGQISLSRRWRSGNSTRRVGPYACSTDLAGFFWQHYHMQGLVHKPSTAGAEGDAVSESPRAGRCLAS